MCHSVIFLKVVCAVMRPAQCTALCHACRIMTYNNIVNEVTASWITTTTFAITDINVLCHYTIY